MCFYCAFSHVTAITYDNYYLRFPYKNIHHLFNRRVSFAVVFQIYMQSHTLSQQSTFL